MYDRDVSTYLCTDAIFRRHRLVGEHPERPERLVAIDDALDAAELRGRCRTLVPRPATREEILRVHSAEHLDGLISRMGDEHPEQSGWLDPDTYFGPGSYQAALHAAGVSVDLALKVLAGKQDNGFAAVRPPGHHATRNRAMGFCLLNNVAIAAAAARARGARVAIMDFDVHHGNGTDDIFVSDPDVLFISTHQYPFYPGSGEVSSIGEGLARGTKINIPLPQGCGDAAYRLCFEKIVLPALLRFAPDLLLVSAGFDAHQCDPLAGMALSEDGFADLLLMLLSVQPRVAALLEGGYNLGALSRSVVAFVEALLGERSLFEGGHGDSVSPDAQAAIRAARLVHNL
jgi:acetoin utilization deacetylase AcuC-like enzyme